jgi:hypothetical protein
VADLLAADEDAARDDERKQVEADASKTGAASAYNL